ncbi:MAG TPA: hypothetical protein VMB72_07485 [Acidimicrobiales bacterium]|nr:hypothetical protein [Acidimicrobiales bacterium]
MPQRHRPELSESVAGEKLTGYRRAPRTFGAHRVCSAPGCDTRLSMYNAGALCSSHAVHHPTVATLGDHGAHGRGRAVA